MLMTNVNCEIEQFLNFRYIEVFFFVELISIKTMVCSSHNWNSSILGKQDAISVRYIYHEASFTLYYETKFNVSIVIKHILIIYLKMYFGRRHSSVSMYSVSASMSKVWFPLNPDMSVPITTTMSLDTDKDIYSQRYRKKNT